MFEEERKVEIFFYIFFLFLIKESSLFGFNEEILYSLLLSIILICIIFFFKDTINKSLLNEILNIAKQIGKVAIKISELENLCKNVTKDVCESVVEYLHLTKKNKQFILNWEKRFKYLHEKKKRLFEKMNNCRFLFLNFIDLLISTIITFLCEIFQKTSEIIKQQLKNEFLGIGVLLYKDTEIRKRNQFRFLIFEL